MHRILIVDNEEKLRQAIVKYARFQGYETVEAADGLEAVRLCRTQRFDLILLDVMMPRMDGVTACREIRKLCNTPVLILTARGEEYDRIAGFEAGADDYVVKPFFPHELMLRMAVILKRAHRGGAESQNVCVGGLNLSYTGRWLTVDGARVSLTGKEFDLLAYLVAHSGVVLTRQEIIESVWGSETESGTRSLDTHIKQLRRALGPYHQYIVTLRGVGYRFEEA
ncbi:MAG: Response regulator consisting of a CheY-like receiver domain and a winged-helix DNA-binding domain [Oscillospiraceae bacterium]|nr:Response regulator consisting of a CheY-like receiver domain and a winged-helix DNA-binding domain [Oscillospiraceae bacterium]